MKFTIIYHFDCPLENSSYIYCVQYSIYVFSILRKPWHILISDLVTDLFIYLLPGTILLYLAVPFYTKGVFA